MKPNFGDKDCSGIYQIRNRVDGKIYVGRTKCFYKRCYQYLYDLKERNLGHINNYLYRAITKYGINNFSFEVLEYCSNEITPERELYWIIKLKTTDRSHGYNLRLDVNGSMVTSEETSKKISARLKREWKEGSRSQHSQKLKQSWMKRNREEQGKTFTRYLTKYLYFINGSVSGVNYKELRELKLETALSSFHRTGLDIVTCKGYQIERRKVNHA